MKVTAVQHWGHWTVRIQQGCQGFHLASSFGNTKAHALWMARMFRIALKNHDEQKAQRKKKR